MKRITAFFLFLILTISVSCAEPFRVFDSADLFTPEEEAALEAAILNYRYNTRTDFCILTTDDFLGYTDDVEFAFQFFTRLGIGIGTPKNGAILYIDMYNRIPSFYRQLYRDNFISDEAVLSILDEIHPSLVYGDYAQAALLAVKLSQEHHDAYWSALLEP